MEIGIGLLGPMTATVDTASFLPGAGKPRQVLAMLALRHSRPVQTSRLIEELWGATPPRSALTTLQTYVLQLRRRLGDATERGGTAPKDILATSSGGYLLSIDKEQTDVGRFELLCKRAQQHFDEQDDQAASRLLAQALELWRGPVLSDVRAGRHLEIETMRLTEIRLGAVELRVAAELRLGHHQRLIGELMALAEAHPLHEHLHAQLILALYRSGRTGEALGAFRRLRRTLVTELGLEPGRHVRQLHEAILSGDAERLELEGPPRTALLAS